MFIQFNPYYYFRFAEERLYRPIYLIIPSYLIQNGLNSSCLLGVITVYVIPVGLVDVIHLAIQFMNSFVGL